MKAKRDVPDALRACLSGFCGADEGSAVDVKRL